MATMQGKDETCQWRMNDAALADGGHLFLERRWMPQYFCPIKRKIMRKSKTDNEIDASNR